MNKKDSNKKTYIIVFLKKYGGILVICIILLSFLFLVLLDINFGQWLANSVQWFYDEFGDFGIYLGIFLISIFGNVTIFFPVPYIVALIAISAIIPNVNPILIGLIAGLGASLGEISAWLVGRSSKELIGDSKSMKRMKRYVDKGWAPALIFLFAATPLPDDPFLIVLGLAQYSLVKTLAFCFIGKFTLCFLCSALPIWLADTSLGNFLFGLFGIDLNAARTGIIPPSNPIDILQSSLVWAASIIILFLLVYIDWSKVFYKVKAKLKPKEKVN